MADIFNAEGGQTNPLDGIDLNDLVGEGRKYSDPDQLAKGYAHLEVHSKNLEKELADLRAAQDLRDASLNNHNNPVDNGQEQPPVANQPLETPNNAPRENSPTPGNVDFRSQIREEVKALNEADRFNQNLDSAVQKLIDLHGSEDGAAQAIRKRAQELNVSVEWLRDSAGKSPDAFFATMGLDKTPTNRMTPAPRNEMRTNPNDGRRDFEFYDKMRKDNPKLYYSRETQAEMLAQAKQQGSDFYRR